MSLERRVLSPFFRRFPSIYPVALSILSTGVIACGGPGRSPVAASGESSGAAATRTSPTVAPSAVDTAGITAKEDDTIFPSIVLAPQKGVVSSTLHFSFEGESHRLAVAIDRSLVEGARKSRKETLSTTGEKSDDWSARYDDAIMNDPAQEPFFKKLLTGLRDLKKKLKLDSDRYLELMVAVVQHIPYDPTADRDPRFPVETVADGQGDCDDRSRLLAALISREGYAVALLHFDNENHMAVGIKADGLEYRSSGYALIETTSPSMIGFPFEKDATVRLTTKPVPIPVGKGKARYTAMADVIFLKKTMDDIDESQRNSAGELKRLGDACERLKKEAEEAEAATERLRGRPAAEQNKAIEAYNKAVARYNEAVVAQKNVAVSLNARIMIYNYISENNHNARYPVTLWVKSKLK